MTSYTSCLRNQEEIKIIFEPLDSPEKVYSKIIELGKELPNLDAAYLTDENLISGCQSVMHLHSEFDGSVVTFNASSDALISKGLAYLLIRTYSGESPVAILKCPPKFLEALGITGSLSPSRANGLISLYTTMKQRALKCLISVK